MKGHIQQSEIYFRLVPPFSGGNPSLGHIDYWYDDLYEIPMTLRPTHKLWISLQTSPSLNGLLLKKVPISQYKYSINNTKFGPRPLLSNPLHSSFYDFPDISSGDAILFDSSCVLHMGAKNYDHFSRISVEISLMIP